MDGFDWRVAAPESNVEKEGETKRRSRKKKKKMEEKDVRVERFVSNYQPRADARIESNNPVLRYFSSSSSFFCFCSFFSEHAML